MGRNEENKKKDVHKTPNVRNAIVFRQYCGTVVSSRVSLRHKMDVETHRGGLCA